MKKNMLVSALLLYCTTGVFFSGVQVARGHGGGLNAWGCHQESATELIHCHRQTLILLFIGAGAIFIGGGVVLAVWKWPR